jgi:uncharacterized protein YhbP (UPF0306 family)
MRIMDEQMVEFLKLHRISVLSILMPAGVVHGATMHYAFDESSKKFVFMTEKQSRKGGAVVDGGVRQASLVIGFSEEEWLTAQLSGMVRAVNEEEMDWAWKLYSNKFNGSDKHRGDEGALAMMFEPTWWRFSKVRPKPGLVRTSED